MAAFAAILRDGSVVTWGQGSGGDSSSVQDQLKNVQQIRASSGAIRRHVGMRALWRRQQFRARQAEERETDPTLSCDFCRFALRWVCRQMGRCTPWRGQQFRARPAEVLVKESSADEHVVVNLHRANMSVNMCIYYIYMSIHYTCIQMYMCVYIHICIYVCTYVYAHTHLYIYTHVLYTYTCIYMSIRIQTKPSPSKTSAYDA